MGPHPANKGRAEEGCHSAAINKAKTKAVQETSALVAFGPAPHRAALTPPGFHLQERLETIFYSISPCGGWRALSWGRTRLLPPSHKHSLELEARVHRFIYKNNTEKEKKNSKITI